MCPISSRGPAGLGPPGKGRIKAGALTTPTGELILRYILSPIPQPPPRTAWGLLGLIQQTRKSTVPPPLSSLTLIRVALVEPSTPWRRPAGRLLAAFLPVDWACVFVGDVGVLL